MTMPHHLFDAPAEPGFRLPAPGKMTEEEFVAWCDQDTRAEWVDGDVIMMSPTNLEHGVLVSWLSALLRLFVERDNRGTVACDVWVRLGDPPRRRGPDIVFLAEEHRQRMEPTHINGPPDLIVEIVAPESPARDWREKYLEYEAAGVREYWVIDPASQHMEAYVLQAAAPAAQPAYRRVAEREGAVSSVVLSGLRLRTAWLWPATRPKLAEALREMEAAV